jgi:hypothetical protein
VKVAKAHAYTTPGSIAPLVTPDECARLFTLPALAFKLFVCLVHVVDFKTGHGHTGYPELIAMLTPAQPERGRPVEVPTRDQVKHMLRRFIDLGLIARDKAMSEARGNIIFHMQPRSWASVSNELAARVSARGASAQNHDGIGAKPKRARTSRPGSRPHSHEPISLTPTPENAKLSTSGTDQAQGPTEGEKMTPPRGLNDAPTGPTPPPEARTGTEEGQGQGSQHQAPQGGQNEAPTGHAPRWVTPNEEPGAWRIGPPLPIHAPGVDMADPANWQRDAKGRLVVPVGHGMSGKPTRRERQAGATPLPPVGGLRKAALS